MGIEFFQTGWLRRLMLAVSLMIAAPLGLSACASSSYAGIPFAPGAADPELQGLAQRAQVGDKQAQLELGIRYEEGRGVPVDLGRARHLYTQAASDSGGTIYAYSPPVGSNGRGRVLPVNTGPRREGLVQARARLTSLEPEDPIGQNDETLRPLDDSVEPVDLTDRAIERRFREVVIALSGKRSGDTAELARELVAPSTSDSSPLRGEVVDFLCPPEPSAVPEIFRAIVCSDSEQVAIVIHIWDEVLAPEGAITGTTGPGGCMTISAAYGVMRIRGWNSELIHSAPLPNVQEGENGFSLGRLSGALPTEVDVSPIGDVIYIPHFMNGGCLASVFIMLRT